MQEPIQTVLLDADGVIQSDSPHKRSMFDLACGDPNRTEEFIAEVFDAEDPFLVGNGDFASKLAEIVNRRGDRASLQQCLRAWTAIVPSQAVLDLVSELRSAAVFVGIASNQEAYRANYMSTNLGYCEHFDQEFYSCDIGFVKPDKNYFRAVLDKLATEPSSVLFLDDNQPIVDVAIDCGISAFRFDLKHQPVTDMRALLVEHQLFV